MNKRELVAEYGTNIEQDILLADGFDDAIVGIIRGDPAKAVYDYGKMVDVLMGDGMSEIDAIEYLEYNVVNAYVGEKTPHYMDRI